MYLIEITIEIEDKQLDDWKISGFPELLMKYCACVGADRLNPNRYDVQGLPLRSKHDEHD